MAKKITIHYLPKSTKVDKIQDVRAIIKEQMARQKKSAYALAKITGLTEQAIYSYATHKTDMRSERLALLLAALNLEIRPK